MTEEFELAVFGEMRWWQWHLGDRMANHQHPTEEDLQRYYLKELKVLRFLKIYFYFFVSTFVLINNFYTNIIMIIDNNLNKSGKGQPLNFFNIFKAAIKPKRFLIMFVLLFYNQINDY